MERSPWVTLGVPRIGTHLLLIARNVLGMVAVLVFVMWRRGRLTHLTVAHCAVAALLGLVTATADLVVLADRQRWHRVLGRLAPELIPLVKELGLTPPLVLYSSSALCLTWMSDESAFVVLVAPKKPEAGLLEVRIPAGFKLELSTLEAWTSFVRTDVVRQEQSRRGRPFAERIFWGDFGVVALRGATPSLAARRVLELMIDAIARSTRLATGDGSEQASVFAASSQSPPDPQMERMWRCEVDRLWDTGLLLARVRFSLVPFLMMVVLVKFGYGLVALLVAVVGNWPYRYELELSGSNLTIRWLLARTHLDLNTLQDVRLVPDPRRFLIGKRGTSLQIKFPGRRPLTIYAGRVVLEDIHSHLSARVSSG